MRGVVLVLVLGGCDLVFTPVAISDFDPATCPSEYAFAHGGSRYRFVDLPLRSAIGASNACNADLPGATHLASVLTLDEANAIQIEYDAPNNALMPPLWIGAVQLPDAATTRDNWITVTGEPFPPELWSSPEPDDGQGVEDGQEQFAEMGHDKRFYIDIGGFADNGAICECDGRGMNETAAAAFVSNAMTAP